MVQASFRLVYNVLVYAQGGLRVNSNVEGAMLKAIWNRVVLAESDQCVIVEGNQYFPPNTIKLQYFKPTSTHTTCPWKGEASYYDIEVAGQVNKDAAWYYPSPKEAARHIAGHVAFWKGVKVE